MGCNWVKVFLVTIVTTLNVNASFQIFNSSKVDTRDVILSVRFESGTGSSVKIRITGELGTIDREYYYSFG